MKKTILITLVMALITFYLASGVSIDQDNVVISSDETFYCQNIISEDGCLIKSYVDITNNRPSAINPMVQFDSTTTVRMRTYHTDDTSISLVDQRGRSLISTNPILIMSGETERIYMDFYASESGKFDYSIFFTGITVTLDPFYNVTYNSTSPSLHLKQGANNSIDDNIYNETVEITSGLNDNSDTTTFRTNIKQEAEAIYKLDEGSGSNIEDSSGNNNDGTAFGTPTYIGTPVLNSDHALDFDGLNDRLNIPDNGQFQFGNSVTDIPFTMMAWINITDMTTFRIAYKYVTFQEFIWGFTGGDNLLLWLQDESTSGYLRGDSASTQTAKQGEWFHLTTVYNGNHSDEGIQHYINGTAISMSYLGSGTYVAMEDTGEDVDIAYGGGANYGEGAIDEFYVFKEALNQSQIQSIVDNGLDITTNAIKATFNITMDGSNEYYLKTRKTSSGVDTLNIYLYEDNNTINLSTLDSHTITTGWDAVPLENSAVDGHQPVFRIFTDQRSYISEVELIESINDSIFPSIQDEAINDTVLTCGDSIRLQANVTDNSFIDHVFFKYNDNNGTNIQEADKLIDTDIYYIDIQYVHGTWMDTEVYNLSSVNATDIVQQSTISPILLAYNYTCMVDLLDPVITPEQGGTVDVTVFDEFNYSAGCFDDSPHNFTLRIHNESDDILLRFNETAEYDINLSITGTLSLSGIGLGEYTINHTCIDDSGNTKQENYALILSEETIASLILTAPPNNTVIRNNQVIFSYTIPTSATIDLYINETLTYTMTSSVGSNSFPQITINENNTFFEWHLNATKGQTSLGSESLFFTTNLTNLPPTREDEFSIYNCPVDTLPRALLFMFIIVLGFGIYALAFWIKSGLVGALGAMILLMISLNMYACIVSVAMIMTLLSVFMILFIWTKSTSRRWE